MKPRKLEYFEDQLNATPQGSAVLEIIRNHAKEVLYLVQKNRATMVCWQRHHGPVFIKSLVDSGFEEEKTFIKEVKGVTIETLLLHMAEVLQDNGSPELKEMLGQHVFKVLHIVKHSNSLNSILEQINFYQ